MAARRAPDHHRPITIEQFEAMPREDEYRIELVRGMVVREPRPGTHHGVVAIEIAHRLASFVKKHRLGIVIGDAGFVLEQSPPSVRGPDAAFVSTARIPPGAPRRGFWRLGPDLAVEILSPWNRPRAVHEKLEQYFAAGTRVAWVVDPFRETVAVHEPGKDARTLAASEVLGGEPVLPGFTVKVKELFPVLP
jgi:Uma2 family endonuclease